MAAPFTLVIKKTFLYRGVAEEWDNKYHFTGTSPATTSDWTALTQAVWNLERAFLGTATGILGAVGYLPGAVVSSYNQLHADTPFSNPLGVISTGTQPPGDAAAWVRWSTGTRTSKGKPIYLRKYFHNVNLTPPDTILTAARTAMIAYGTGVMNGTLPGSAVISSPTGTAAISSKVPTFVTTRTLKRRGADPS